MSYAEEMARLMSARRHGRVEALREVRKLILGRIPSAGEPEKVFAQTLIDDLDKLIKELKLTR